MRSLAVAVAIMLCVAPLVSGAVISAPGLGVPSRGRSALYYVGAAGGGGFRSDYGGVSFADVFGKGPAQRSLGDIASR